MIKEFIFLLEVNFNKSVKIILVIILEMSHFWTLLTSNILFHSTLKKYVFSKRGLYHSQEA